MYSARMYAPRCPAHLALALLILGGCTPGREISEVPREDTHDADTGGSTIRDSSDGDTADTAGDSAGETDTDTDVGDTTPVRLNQLVTRLLRAEDVASDGQRWTITREHPGWLFVTANATLTDGQTARVGIDVAEASEAQVLVDASGSDTEAMLEVAAGNHSVTVWLEGGAVLDVEVRAIPELRFDRFNPDDDVDVDLGDEWSFLEANALPHLTTMVADWHWNGSAMMDPWRAANRSWSTNSGNPYGTDEELRVAYDYYVGVAAASGIGLDLDEFGGDDLDQWAAWTSALTWASEQYPDTPLSLYTGDPEAIQSEGPAAFVTAMLGLDQELLLETYIGEQPDEASLQVELDGLSASFSTSRVTFPGLEDNAVIVLCGASQSYVNFDYRPDVDFHVHLDRQFQHLANDPAFADLHGLGFWTSGYMDEESIRWMMALYRHYGIEGATEPLSDDPYNLAFVQNPDFEAEEGWELATSGQIGVGEYEWVSEYEARWGSPEGVGDTYLHTTRGSGAASTATQVLEGLEPGRTYSLRYFTIWYEDLYNLRGDDYDYQRDHSVHATVDGATVEGESILATESTWPGSGVWVNQHRLRFVPDTDTVTLTLWDWQTETEPGGEVWETFLFNFVQVQPYFEE